MSVEDQNIPSDGVTNPNPSDQTPPSTVPPAQTPPTSDNVSLSKQEYAQLMTQLAFLQNQLEENQQAATSTPPNPFEGKDIDQLTNRELLTLIGQAQEQSQQAVVNHLMNLAVKEEIRDLGDRYEDFKKDSTVRDEVLLIAKQSPHLSLEQAYMIHKGAKPPAAPSVAPPTPPPSQRSDVTPTAVQESKPMSIREAAEAAMKALKYNI